MAKAREVSAPVPVAMLVTGLWICSAMMCLHVGVPQKPLSLQRREQLRPANRLLPARARA